MKILTLFFTYGTSLKDWNNNGSIDREINIYKKLLKYFDKIYFLTYGENDLQYSSNLPQGIEILPKKIKVNNFLYSILIPYLHKKEISKSSWLKTNQMFGSWSAVLSKMFFRKNLAIRTGFTQSLTLLNANKPKKVSAHLMEYLAYKLSDFSIVTSRHQKEYIVNKYKARDIYVIPNGIDLELFKQIKKTDKNKKTELLFVGRFHPEKNLLNLLKAMKDVPDIKLKIIGSGQQEKDLITLKSKYDLDVEIMSNVPNFELPNIYTTADIYIQPSLYEGNPKTILEAMSCGLPVIATNVSGINDVISHLENGFLCGIYPKSIKNAILELKNNDSLKIKIGSNARKYTEKEYDLNECIKKEIELYERYSSNK